MFSVVSDAICEGNVEWIKSAMRDPDYTAVFATDRLLRDAIACNRSDIIGLLLLDPRTVVNYNRACASIDVAIMADDTGTLQIVLSAAEPHSWLLTGAAARVAAHHGKLKVVDWLIRSGIVDPASDDNAMMRRATHAGKWRVVERLLLDARVDPTVTSNAALNESPVDTMKLLIYHRGVRRKFRQEGHIHWRHHRVQEAIVERRLLLVVTRQLFSKFRLSSGPAATIAEFIFGEVGERGMEQLEMAFILKQ